MMKSVLTFLLVLLLCLPLLPRRSQHPDTVPPTINLRRNPGI